MIRLRASMSSGIPANITRIGLILTLIGAVLIIGSGINILIRSHLAPPSPIITHEQLLRIGLIYMMISLLMGGGIIVGGLLGYYYRGYKYGGVWVVGIGLTSMLLSTSLLNILGGSLALIGGVMNIALVTRYYKKRGKT